MIMTDSVLFGQPLDVAMRAATSENLSAGFASDGVISRWSEPSNVTSSAPTTIAAQLTNLFESREPVILKIGLMCIVVIVNLCGNGVSLVIIWKTPRLQTKTFALLFNLTTVDLLTGLMLIAYAIFDLVVYVLNDDPCRYLVLIAVMTFVPRYPIYVSMNSVGLIAYERFIAIALPMRYEMLVTENALKIAVAVVWIICLPLTITYAFLPDGIDWTTCTVSEIHRKALVTDVACLLTAFTLIGGLYICIMVIALRQRSKINAQVRCFATAIYTCIDV
jgi:7 transmembrane receptor (rhodopsin family)